MEEHDDKLQKINSISSISEMTHPDHKQNQAPVHEPIPLTNTYKLIPLI
jgi:hypothetical protein